MKTSNNATRTHTTHRLFLALLWLVPLLSGGCPEFRNDVVSIFESAATSVLLGTEDEWTIVSAVRGSLVDATIGLVFGSLRSNETN